MMTVVSAATTQAIITGVNVTRTAISRRLVMVNAARRKKRILLSMVRSTPVSVTSYHDAEYASAVTLVTYHYAHGRRRTVNHARMLSVCYAGIEANILFVTSH